MPSIPGRPLFRREALIRNVQPEALDDLLRVTAPRERVFLVAVVAVLLGLVAVWAALAA